ncbi:MAG: hypothetical protein ABIG89_04635, partial [Candidatus Woesearchaeota archaeon]
LIKKGGDKMVMKKKAQAAMEFLMTYGWAILVVLVVIGALAYFGVLNPQNLLPEKCTFPSGLYCQDYKINGLVDTISFKIENGRGEGMIITNIDVAGQILTDCDIDLITECDATTVDDVADCIYNSINGWHLANGDSGSVIITCTTAIPIFNGKTKGDITFTYCDDTAADQGDCDDFSHTMNGELMARVEE